MEPVCTRCSHTDSHSLINDKRTSVYQRSLACLNLALLKLGPIAPLGVVTSTGTSSVPWMSISRGFFTGDNDFDLSGFAGRASANRQDNMGRLAFMMPDLLLEEGLCGQIPRRYWYGAESFAWSLIYLRLATARIGTQVLCASGFRSEMSPFILKRDSNGVTAIIPMFLWFD